jgi:CDP-6-deoxy-D-xylo-4-hexulose-3-dehydrase
MKDGFLIGAHHGMNIEDVDRVCNLLKKFADHKLNGKCILM